MVVLGAETAIGQPSAEIVAAEVAMGQLRAEVRNAEVAIGRLPEVAIGQIPADGSGATGTLFCSSSGLKVCSRPSQYSFGVISPVHTFSTSW
jgi:hypothetical protein